MAYKVYLADLTHTGKGIATEAIPLNIGLLKSYALSQFTNGEFDIRLFKYPEALSEAIRREPPSILGCSNYSWNHKLGLKFFRDVKKLKPDCLTVFGGTNYPFTEPKQREFLSSLSSVDMHVFYEGELAFSLLLKRFLETGFHGMFERPIGGVHFFKAGALVRGEVLPRIKKLDTVPSPYASGILDEFFDGKLTPLVETARGCPFKCNFCNAGSEYFANVNKFSDEYVENELSYIAHKASQTSIGHMTLADNNFGMIPRDATTTLLIKELQRKYKWPHSMTAWTGKNSRKRVIEATRILGDTISVSMSVQALDSEVMSNIQRQNIRLEDFSAISDELNRQGRPQHAELIVPLPGDTWEKHLESISALMDSNVRCIQVHTLQILWGTPYKDNDEFISKWGYESPKYRIVPMDFGVYDGEPVFDIETVAVETNTFSFTKYLDSRQLILFIELCYNGGIFELVRKYIKLRDLRVSEWVLKIFQRRDELPEKVRKIIDSFLLETQAELWNSDEEIYDYYSDALNYQKLVSGEAGGNVLYKHKSLLLAECGDDFIQFVFDVTNDLLGNSEDDEEELTALRIFVSSLMKDSYRLDPELVQFERAFTIDVMNWIEDGLVRKLSDYRVETPVNIRFAFEENQIKFKEDAKRRYGTGFQGVIKLLQRAQGSDAKMIRKAYKFNH